MATVTTICAAAILAMLAITALRAVMSESCPDCGGVLEWDGGAHMSERYRCTHCGAKWWYHQIKGR